MKTFRSMTLCWLFCPAMALPSAVPPETPQLRTPEALVGEALKNNPELLGAEADVAAAQGARTQAGLWKNPDLSASYADRRVRNSDGSVDRGFSDQFSLTQTFEFPGKGSLRKAIADEDVELARAGLDQFRQALAGRVKLLAYRYALADINRRAADLVGARFRALIVLLEKRPKAGLQAMFDSGILEGNLAEWAATQRELDQEAVTTLSELNLLRGWPAQTPLQVVVPETAPVLPASLKNMDALVVRGMGTSPILKIKEMELHKSELQRQAGRLDAAPDVAIGPFYSLDKAGDHDRKIGLNATVSLPVWNLNQGNVAAARANVIKAGAAKEQARRELELSLVRICQSRTLLDRQLAETNPGVLARLGRLADMADRHYRLGAVNLQTFLEVQRQFLNATRGAHQAMAEAYSLDLDLQLLTGAMNPDAGAAAGKP